MAPNFDQLATALRQIFFVDGLNLDDPQLLAELGWIHDAIGRGQGPRPPQALIQKTVQTRKAFGNSGPSSLAWSLLQLTP